MLSLSAMSMPHLPLLVDLMPDSATSFLHPSEIYHLLARDHWIDGSGKSNFFAVIQFVLHSMTFMHLRQPELQ